MAFKAIMKIEEKEFEILYYRFETHQTLNDSGSVTSPMQYAHFYLELVFIKDDFLLNWSTQPADFKDVVIDEYYSNSSPFKSINLSGAYCIQFEEKFSHEYIGGASLFLRAENSANNFMTCLTLTAGEVSIRDAKLQNF